MLTRITLVLLAASVPIGFSCFIDYNAWALAAIIIANIIFILSLFLARRGNIAIPHIALPSVVLILSWTVQITGYGISDVATFGYPLALALGGLLLPSFHLVIFTLLTLMLLVSVFLMEIMGMVINPVAGSSSVDDVMAITGFLAATTSFVYMMTHRLRKLNHELEGRVQRRTAQLQATNRELEAFAHAVSHDLTSPLRRVLGFTALLNEDCAGQLPPEGEEHLERITGSVKQMNELVESLLELSRIRLEDMAHDEVDFSRLANRIVSTLKEGDPHRHVTIRIEKDMRVRGDDRFLAIMLQNLLGNAWKFTAQRDDAEIELRQTSESGIQCFRLTDNGAGFDPKYCEKLFRAFERLHPSSEFKGNGVGLTTVQRIVHLHGGRIWADGHPGQGASFFFTLSA